MSRPVSYQVLFYPTLWVATIMSRTFANSCISHHNQNNNNNNERDDNNLSYSSNICIRVRAATAASFAFDFFWCISKRHSTHLSFLSLSLSFSLSFSGYQKNLAFLTKHTTHKVLIYNNLLVCVFQSDFGTPVVVIVVVVVVRCVIWCPRHQMWSKVS